MNAWCPQLATSNTEYFNTILHLRGMQPPRKGSDLDEFSLSTFYGHHVVRQLTLGQTLQPPPPDLTVFSSSSESEDVIEVADRGRSRTPPNVD